MALFTQGSGRHAPPSPYPPIVHYAFVQDVVKEEDAVLAKSNNRWPSEKEKDAALSCSLASACEGRGAQELDTPTSRASGASLCDPTFHESSACFGLYCIFAGRQGDLCSEHCRQHLLRALRPLLPAGEPPPEGHRAAYKAWREAVQQALLVAVVSLQRGFAGRGVVGGCEATIILQSDWLLTVASLGSVRAVLDTGREMVPLTYEEPQRRGLGNYGDQGAGEPLVPLPSITQVLAPHTGARLILASRHVWAVCTKIGRASNTIRSWSNSVCPQRILDAATLRGGRQQDTCVIVVDMLPPNRQTFAEVAGVLPAWRRTLFSGKNKATRRVVDESRAATQLLERVDMAVVAGAVPGALLEPPVWYTEELADAIHEALDAAPAVWAAARGVPAPRPPTLLSKRTQSIPEDSPWRQNAANPRPAPSGSLSIRTASAMPMLNGGGVARASPGDAGYWGGGNSFRSNSRSKSFHQVDALAQLKVMTASFKASGSLYSWPSIEMGTPTLTPVKDASDEPPLSQQQQPVIGRRSVSTVRRKLATNASLDTAFAARQAAAAVAAMPAPQNDLRGRSLQNQAKLQQAQAMQRSRSAKPAPPLAPPLAANPWEVAASPESGECFASAVAAAISGGREASASSLYGNPAQKYQGSPASSVLSGSSAESPPPVSPTDHPHSIGLQHFDSNASDGMLEFSFGPSSSLTLTKVTGRAPLLPTSP